MVDFALLEEDSNFLVDLGRNVWLMDDHRWALSVWNQLFCATGNRRFSLIHLDYHWDGINDFHEEPQDAARLVTATQDELVRFIEDDRLIRFDSFIAPAVIRKMVDSIHLYCLQDDGTDAGVDATLLQENNCSQTIYSSYGDLAKRKIPNPVVLDLCLDLFNRSDMYDQGDLWSAEEIDAFLSEFRRQIQAADLITISLSFGYSGTEGDTRALARHVVPQILAQRNET